MVIARDARLGETTEIHSLERASAQRLVGLMDALRVLRVRDF